MNYSLSGESRSNSTDIPYRPVLSPVDSLTNQQSVEAIVTSQCVPEQKRKFCLSRLTLCLLVLLICQLLVVPIYLSIYFLRSSAKDFHDQISGQGKRSRVDY